MYKNICVVQIMKTLPLSEFRANASATLDLVEQGQSVRIMRHGRPVADLVPVREHDDERQPSWKQPFAPLHLPVGASLSRAVREDADVAGAP